ncbi:MAG: late competence development ComFB family protein [Microcoleaceae cyanobacterium]
MSASQRRRYHNVMEDMVSEEVRSQMTQLSPRLTQYIQRTEVETYALNRLPPLYASSKEGWLYQQKRGRAELLSKVKTAVRQALMAVQQDPLRNSTPIVKEQEEQPVKRKVVEVSNEPDSVQKQMPTHPYYWQQNQDTRSRRKVR